MRLNTKDFNKTAEKNYLQSFPKRTSDDLKFEIGKIAQLLVENKPSNRYTDFLKNKANKDKSIQRLKGLKDFEVDIINYDNGKMEAALLYKNLENDYKLVLNMETVSRGRLFLKKYSTEKIN